MVGIGTLNVISRGEDVGDDNVRGKQRSARARRGGPPLLRETRARAHLLGELHQRLARLVGSAESADGRIRAQCTMTDLPAKLDIDPSAMRLTPRELADTISEVIREASTDLRQKLHETIDAKDDEGPGRTEESP